MVRLLASHSTNVALLDVSADKAEPVVTSLETDFPKTKFLFKKCDISNWDEQKSVFEQIHEQFGSIDIVFANAGVSEVGNFFVNEEEPTKPNLKTLDIDLLGTLYSKMIAVDYKR